MVRRVIAVVAGIVLVGLLAVSPTAAQTEDPDADTQSPTTVEVEGESTLPPPTTAAAPQPEVKGDVVSRPLPRTGSDLNGTALFGGVLTVVGIALALGARRRRNAFDG